MIFTLKNGLTTAECSTRGGELISFKFDGIEYVWQGDSSYWSGQAPLLFPVVCAPLDGRVTYDGVSYPMMKHGFVRGTEFRAVELAPDRVVFERGDSEETHAMFPYRFRLRVTHTLHSDGFDTEYTVVAGDDMVFNIGGHPAFNCPIHGGEKFEDYEIRFKNCEGAVMSLTEGGYMDPALPKLDRIKNGILPLEYSDFDRDAMIIENLPEKKIALMNKDSGHGIGFFFEGFNALGIWTPIGKNAPFVCLEPWCGLPASVDESGRAEDKKYAVHLCRGEVFSVKYGARVI